ncbi:hypothetical protein SALBM311S_00278 [Streptomyces alboniger]
MNVLKAVFGEFGGNVPYALAARRHMELCTVAGSALVPLYPSSS